MNKKRVARQWARSADLRELADAIEDYLQIFQEKRKEVSRNGGQASGVPKLRFPTGYFHRLAEHQRMWEFVSDEPLRENIGRALMFDETIQWLLDWWGVYAAVRGMIIKYGVINICAIVEAAVKFALAKRKGDEGMKEKKPFSWYVDELKKEGVIDDQLADKIKELWEYRSNIHIHCEGVNNKYDDDALESARYVLKKLRWALSQAFSDCEESPIS